MLFSFQGELAKESVINYFRNFTSHFTENHQHNTAFTMILPYRLFKRQHLCSGHIFSSFLRLPSFFWPSHLRTSADGLKNPMLIAAL